MHRPLFAVSILAALALLAEACSSNNAGSASGGSAGASATAAANYLPPLPAGTQVTISFADYNVATAGLGKDATVGLVNDFEKQFPNIKVDFEAITPDQMISKTHAEVVAGNPPDLAQEGFGDLDYVVNYLKAKPIDSLISPDELKQWEQGIHPKALALTQLNGHIAGVPYVFSTPTLFYNADLFRQAGLNPDNPPQTWADVKTDALAIKNKTGKAGLNIACLGAFDWCFQGMVDSDGGAVLSADKSKLQFDSTPVVDTLNMWQDLVNSGAHPALQANDATTAFQSGNMGMYLQTSAVQSSLLASAQGKWDLRAAGMPSFAGKAVKPTNSGSALFILTNDRLKERAAWELAKFMTSEHAYTVITSQIGYLPLRPGIVNDPQYLKPWADAHPLIQSNLKQLDSLTPWVSYPGPNYTQIKDILMTDVENVVYHNMDPQKTMSDAQQRGTALMPKQ
jgi:multiple sugar transport system substrate-binding protein